MRLYYCPHCDDIIELTGPARNEAQCDCGGVLELLAPGSDDARMSDEEFARIENEIATWEGGR